MSIFLFLVICLKYIKRSIEDLVNASDKGTRQMKKERSKYYGPVMMLLAAICFSLGGLLCKLIPWSALAINGFRDLIGSMILGAYMLITHRRLRVNPVVIFGAVCMFGVTTLFVMANKMTTAANTIVLQYTAPIWVLILMALLFHKKPARADYITIAAVFLGILGFFIDSLSAGGLTGDLLAILAGVFYAGLFILNSFERGDAISSLFLGQLAAGVLLTPLLARETDFSIVPVTAAVILGVVQVGLAYVFFYLGTKHTAPVTASLIAGVEPVLNPVLVAVFWGEHLSPLSLCGAAVVILAILLYNLRGAGNHSPPQP